MKIPIDPADYSNKKTVKKSKGKHKMMKSIPNTEKCLVCFETFVETPDEIAVQLNCTHCFHYDCIMESYKMKTDRIRECPYCRKSGGYLPLLKGEVPLKNIHKEYKLQMEYNKYYGHWGRCKGILKCGKQCTNRAKSIPGELYCLSSEPLFRNEYIL